MNLKTGACFILIYSLEPETFTAFHANNVAVRASYITKTTLLRTFPKRDFHLQFFSIVKQNSQGISRLFQVQHSQLPFWDVFRRIKGQHFLWCITITDSIAGGESRGIIIAKFKARSVDRVISDPAVLQPYYLRRDFFIDWTIIIV